MTEDNGAVPCSQQLVEVVGNQCPGIAEGLGLLEDLTQSVQEMFPVGIGGEYPVPFDAPAHDVVEAARGVYSRSSRHKNSIPRPTAEFKLNS